MGIVPPSPSREQTHGVTAATANPVDISKEPNDKTEDGNLDSIPQVELLYQIEF